MDAVNWELVGVLVGTLSTLVGIPLTAIVLYLRAIREDQRSVQTDLRRQIERVENQCNRAESSVEHFERHYATKEEWNRENMLARRQLGHLTELMARLQAELESSRGLATQFVRATNAIIGLTERLGRRLENLPSRQADGDARVSSD